MGCCEHGNELSCSIKGRNSWPTDVQLYSWRPCAIGFCPRHVLLGMPAQLSPSACLQGKRPSPAILNEVSLTSWSRPTREANSCSASYRIPSVLCCILRSHCDVGECTRCTGSCRMANGGRCGEAVLKYLSLKTEGGVTAVLRNVGSLSPFAVA